MIDPTLYSATPFNDRTALRDYFGFEALFHGELVRRVYALTGKVYRTWPLGDGGTDDWLQIHQREMVSAANALGISTPVDLSNYQLSEATDFASFMFLGGVEHKRLMRAAGII